MKTVNLKFFVVVLFAALCTLASCSKKKDDVAPPASPMAGKWVGKWGHGNTTTVYFSFTINSNGTLTVEEGNNANPGTGTWTLNGDTFKSIYSYNDNPGVKLNVAAKVNAARTEIEGEWGDGEVNQNGGNFYMVKQ
jgi:hypothetical protein